MSENAGYVCRNSNGERSPMLRKQWFIGNEEEIIRNFVLGTAKVLMSGYSDGGKKIGSGTTALRNDLDIDRLFAAMVKTIYNQPFDSIYAGIAPDIANNGIYEIEMLDWNLWNINNYSVESHLKKDIIGEKKILGVASFGEGKMLNDGFKFEWKGGVDK